MLQQRLPESQQPKVEGGMARFFATWLMEGKEEGWVSYSTICSEILCPKGLYVLLWKDLRASGLVGNVDWWQGNRGDLVLVTCLVLTRAVGFMLWTSDLWEVVRCFLEGMLVNKKNLVWGMGVWVAGERAGEQLGWAEQKWWSYLAWRGECKLAEQWMNAYRAPSHLLLLLVLPELCIRGLLWCLIWSGMFRSGFD